MRALDLFAGTGWGVACHWLGIEEFGVEIMPEAVATREANGMKTIFRDVWDGLLGREDVPAYDILIASPPCQTFSMAGKGAGRQALDEVIQAVTDHLYKDPAELIKFGEAHDPRTALVLAPLAYIWRDKPRYVVLEQVPTVQPVWEAYAETMRGWGYNVETAVLNAEQYGVPQTRRRSILVAHLNGPVALPVPTHSKYYSRNPTKLDEGVLPWISMAEALGWVPAGAQSFTQNNKQAHQSRRPLDAPAPTVTAGHDSGNRGFLDADGALTVADAQQVATLQSYPQFLRSNYGTGGDPAARGERTVSQPAATVTSRAIGAKWDAEANLQADEAATLQSYPHFLRSNYSATEVEGEPRVRAERPTDQPAATVTSKADRAKWDGETRLSVEEAAALQTYPGRGLADRPSPTITGGGVETGGAEPIAKLARYTEAEGWQGSTARLSTEEAAVLQSYPADLVLRNGNQANATQRTPDQPAPTVMFGQRVNKVEWMPQDLAKDPAASGVRVTQEEAATLQSYPEALRPEWASVRPATTIMGDSRIAAAGHHEHQMKGAYKATVEESATLQTYPQVQPFIWCGTKSKVFLQIGNAVPPDRAAAVVAAGVSARYPPGGAGGAAPPPPKEPPCKLFGPPPTAASGSLTRP